jgi:Zn-dependent oligopeptidase
LRTFSGERVRWRRLGSLRVASIHKPIDEYEIFNTKGETIGIIYISPYHLKTSRKAPAGFKIV